jgi:surfeit locus 1 family protein
VFVVLIGLGTWQVQRKAWKEALIASLTERLNAVPTALPAPATWPRLDPANEEYRRVAFSAEFDNTREALVYGAASAFRPDASGLGYWVLTPARLADGSVVMVNRGFVPDGRQDPKSRPGGELTGPVPITGVLRWPDSGHWFTPKPDATHNLWFSRDLKSIAAAKGLAEIAPFYVEQEGPVPRGGLPLPGKIVVRLSNDHLQYAVTWFGLAVALAAFFVVWALGSRRTERAREAADKARKPH